MFNVNDPIFQLKEKLSEDEWEEVESWSRCNCCGETNKKLKCCHFCGQLTCPTDLNHQRAYPMDNPSRKKFSTQVCLTCNSKLHYRDAMFELTHRLERFGDHKLVLEEELKSQEFAYDITNKKLTKQKTDRAKIQ